METIDGPWSESPAPGWGHTRMINTYLRLNLTWATKGGVWGVSDSLPPNEPFSFTQENSSENQEVPGIGSFWNIRHPGRRDCYISDLGVSYYVCGISYYLLNHCLCQGYYCRDETS